MKSTFIKKLATLALSVFAIGSFAQCPTINSLLVQQTADSAVVYAMMTPSTTAGPLHWTVSPSTATMFGGGISKTFVFGVPGTYTICATYMDSTTMCSSSTCTTVNVTSVTTHSCHAAFTSYLDSTCTTHFVNGSTGSNLTYKWYSMMPYALLSTQANPNLSLGTGSHQIALYTYSNGQFCDSVTKTVHVTCTPTPTNCNASCTYSVLPNCGAYFYSTSTGTNLTYQWRNITTYLGTIISTQNTFTTTLPAGNNTISLYVFSNGQFCDSVTVNVNSCPTSTTTPPCQANSQFTVFADSVNTGNYFAYNQSTGTGVLSYLWDFGDGTTSTQAYPFHQYATPGQYIICLTTTASSGSITCSDVSCDSSSVQRISSAFFMSKLQVLPQGATAVQEQSVLKNLSVYPNPVENELTVEVELAKEEQLHYVITDALGKVVAKNELNSYRTVINTTALDRGMYFLSVSGNNGVLKTTRIVK